MTKKSRRARAKVRATQQVASRGEIKKPEPASVSPEVLKSSTVPPPALAKTARYQYLMSDLIRIGIIAGVLFAILIILSFIL